MITTMAILAVAIPFVYIFSVTRFPDSFFTRNFIWVYLLILLGVFLAHLGQKR